MLKINIESDVFREHRIGNEENLNYVYLNVLKNDTCKNNNY